MEEPRQDHILLVGMGFLASKTVLSAIEIGLFTKLAKPLPTSSLSRLSDRKVAAVGT
jgi:hypothetical protein